MLDYTAPWMQSQGSFQVEAEGQSQRRECDTGSRGQSDVRKKPQAKEWRWALETRKVKEVDSS